MTPAARWRPYIEQALTLAWATLPDGALWILAQVEHESGGDPAAKSEAGAVGLLQLMPGTAREMGLRVEQDEHHEVTGIDERLNPERNLLAGVSYLRQQYDRFGAVMPLDRMLWALASYNCGYGYTKKAMELSREDSRDLGEQAWWTWAKGAYYLTDARCIVHGKRPEAHRVVSYVDGIHATFGRLKAAEPRH